MPVCTGGFGYSPDDPVTVAGGSIFGPFNEKHYLLRLRGPGGGPLEFNRLGSTSGQHILDMYEVRSAGLPEAVHLFLDCYAPGPDGVPAGFTLDRPDEPWALPTSIISGHVPTGQYGTHVGPRKWRIVGADGAVWGYAEWDGVVSVSIDLPKQTGSLLRATVDHFLSITPREHMGTMLEDFFERFLPLDSGGLARGVPSAEVTVPAWKGPVWGADTHREKPATAQRRWPVRWPFGQRREIE
jgi:hypothetical protein